MKTIARISLLASCVFACLPAAAETLVLKNSAGLVWELPKTAGGWSLGSIRLNGKPVEQPARAGLLFLRNLKSGEVRWLAASRGEQTSPQTAKFSGQSEVDGVTFRYDVEVALEEKLPVARLTPRWSVDKDLKGWEVCLTYHDGFANDWRVQSYPWAGNSEKVKIAPMRYCGVPGVLVYRPDLSLVVLFAIDSNADYLNPTTWTGKTNFGFENRKQPPQFCIGGGTLTAAVQYRMPLHLLLSDAGAFAPAVTSVVQSWIQVNHYRVDDTLQVRTPQEAFNLAVEGRRKMKSWKPGIGYEHHKGTPFVYIGNNPYIAYFEYRLYEITGETVWRDRAVEQIAFALKGQQSDPLKPHYGMMCTAWYFQKRGAAEGFCSWDWDHNGYKVDINAMAARYLLQTWQRMKQHDGVDRQDWYKAGVAMADWVVAQQNPDGGLPQCVEIETGKKSNSVVCGRALVALPIIAQITGDERYRKAAEGMERFLREKVEDRFWYTGMHPDLWPNDFEQDSVYAVVEYWLNKHDRTGDKESLDHAVANAYYALLYWCPKQLSWVKNPTQGAHSEQEKYNQYSVYCYGNRKIQCLDRLFKKTGNPLFEQLKNRVMQVEFFTQVAEGPYRGAMTDAIADPWLERHGGYEWRGSNYTSELVSDLMLQLMDMELISKP